MPSRLSPQSLLQLRIELLGTEPLVWRCILVPDTITLVRLHAVIQESMGWGYGHLHEFEIGGQRYGEPYDWDDDPGLINEARKRLRTVLGRRKTLHYLYDFGDSWQHKITLEKRLSLNKPHRYAQCLAGENACPPEDVGGIPGYYEFLEAMADPDHEEHLACMEWWDGSFDPAHFDLHNTNIQLKQIKL